MPFFLDKIQASPNMGPKFRVNRRRVSNRKPWHRRTINKKFHLIHTPPNYLSDDVETLFQNLDNEREQQIIVGGFNCDLYEIT